jgi:uncharacterized protein (TIGR03382 family)
MQGITQRVLRGTVVIAFVCTASGAVADTGDRPSRPPKRPQDIRSHTNQDRTPPLTLHTNQDSFDLQEFWKVKPSWIDDEREPWTVDQTPPHRPRTSMPLEIIIEPFDLSDPVLDVLLGSESPSFEPPIDATLPLFGQSSGRSEHIIVSAPMIDDLPLLDSSRGVVNAAARPALISPIPTPGALSLFGLAAVALLGRRRRPT